LFEITDTFNEAKSSIGVNRVSIPTRKYNVKSEVELELYEKVAAKKVKKKDKTLAESAANINSEYLLQHLVPRTEPRIQQTITQTMSDFDPRTSDLLNGSPSTVSINILVTPTNTPSPNINSPEQTNSAIMKNVTNLHPKSDKLHGISAIMKPQLNSPKPSTSAIMKNVTNVHTKSDKLHGISAIMKPQLNSSTECDYLSSSDAESDTSNISLETAKVFCL
jgi:hypothetical protein